MHLTGNARVVVRMVVKTTGTQENMKTHPDSTTLEQGTMIR